MLKKKVTCTQPKKNATPQQGPHSCENRQRAGEETAEAGMLPAGRGFLGSAAPPAALPPEELLNPELPPTSHRGPHAVPVCAEKRECEECSFQKS